MHGDFPLKKKIFTHGFATWNQSHFFWNLRLMIFIQKIPTRNIAYLTLFLNIYNTPHVHLAQDWHFLVSLIAKFGFPVPELRAIVKLTGTRC